MIEKGYFRSGPNKLFYVYTAPSRQIIKTGIIFVHAANGCRLGPHRMFVELAEKLNFHGYPTLRFDLTGCGDSTGFAPQDEITVESSDVIQAVNFFINRAKLHKVILLGISKGSRICHSIMTHYYLPLCGMILLSNSVINKKTASRFIQNRVKEYICKLKNYRNAWKLLQGKVNIRQVWRTLIYAIEVTRKDKEVQKEVFSSKCPTLFIYGENDPVAEESMRYYTSKYRQNCISFDCHVIKNANHSFFHYKWKEQIFGYIENWLKKVVDYDGVTNEQSVREN